MLSLRFVFYDSKLKVLFFGHVSECLEAFRKAESTRGCWYGGEEEEEEEEENQEDLARKQIYTHLMDCWFDLLYL